MSEYINEDKRKDLKTWIKNFEEVIEDKIIGSNEENKEIFKKVHEDNDNIRKFFVDDYLNNLTNNLCTKSNKDIHSYKDYFKRENFDFENKYYILFKEGKEKGIDNMNDKNQDKNKNYYDYSKYKRKENSIENENKFTNHPKYEYKSETYNINNKNENKNKYDNKYDNNKKNKYVVYNINNKNESKNTNKYDNKYDTNNIKNKYVVYNINNKKDNK